VTTAARSAEVAAPSPRTTFAVPAGRDATAPPERRGLARDGVRLLVAHPGGTRHLRFTDLPAVLDPGDLVVVNTSATLPAALPAVVTGPRSRRTAVHVGAGLDDGSWVVEVRLPDGSGPDTSLAPGRAVDLPGDVRLTLLTSFPDPGRRGARLWRAQALAGDGAVPDRLAYLAAHGRPVTYGYLTGRFPLADYQTVYAAHPGSAEMVSAGRPFSPEVVTRLVAAGITVAPLVLHTGLSSPQAHEPPAPEPFEVPADTARLVTSARAAARRVVAVGTTVVRALESAAGPAGVVRARRGWTDLVLHADRPARVVDALVTGLHEPQASHLMLLEAVVGPDVVERAYAAAVGEAPSDGGPGAGYLWHEFGDSMLLLRDARS
jgi:S-adenosylmethionine:tRNA ribosyltransferase-isomerase